MNELSPRLLALIPLAVGVNLAMGLIVQAVGLPIYLDTIGTVMVAVLAGPAAAVAAGTCSQIVFTIWSGNPMWLTFLPLQIMIGLYAAFVARRSGFRTRTIAVVWGASLGVLAATLSWPISFILWGGVTASGVTLIVALLKLVGAPLGWAVYLASGLTDVVDKTTTFLIVHSLVISLPNRVIGRFPGSARALGRS